MAATVRQTYGRLFLRLTCLAVLSLYGLLTSAHAGVSMILCREEVATKQQRKLAEQLRVITGWSDLNFDADGSLLLGTATPTGGSQKARELLTSVQNGNNLIVIEDAGGSAEVVFGSVVEARWKNGDEERPPAFVVKVDFADFSHVIGDADALAAFNAGWVVLHELYHVTSGAPDSANTGETGECEALINQMRRECRLAVRSEYHFHFFPGANRGEFRTRYVRLAFERQNPSTNKKRRVWLMWDASFVGGLTSHHAHH